MLHKDNDKNTILIVGDWVIDEYWFLVRHYSDISSHTGFIHYRIASDKWDIIRDLCGAGHVTRILYQLFKKQGKQHYLYGLGNWNSNDDELITHLVHSVDKRGSGDESCTAATVNYCLTPTFCSTCPPPLNVFVRPLKPNSSTILVIRQYHQEDGRIEQINRVDWEPKRGQPNNNVDNFLSEINLPPKEQVRAIVINDLKKGVVTKELISILHERYKETPWYVRTKDKELTAIKQILNKIDLLIFGPEVAALLNPWSSWLINNKITIKALEEINKLQGNNIILVSDQHEVIARFKTSDKCITGISPSRPTLQTGFNWTHVFFAYMIFVMCNKKPGERINKDDIKHSMEYADKNSGIPFPKNYIIETQEKREMNIVETKWSAEEKEWKQTIDRGGIIEKNNELRLEVWRAHTLLPDYIVCIKAKQEIINLIGQNLRIFSRKFKSGSKMRSLSILLKAEPGAGKTSLAKSLANIFGFTFLNFDITQMLRRDDLLDLFDTIATAQAKENNPILVFIDEINAPLERSPVYSAFLAPLEEGIYRRQGKFFSLKPCAWIFAGTKFDDNSEKLSDFKSRMTTDFNIDFNSLKSYKFLYNGKTGHKKLEDQARLEQVYLGATIIRKYFPDVNQISKEVLKQFEQLDVQPSPSRLIHKMAASLRNVQYSTVSRENCYCWDEVTWSDPEGDDEKMVKLIFEPGDYEIV